MSGKNISLLQFIVFPTTLLLLTSAARAVGTGLTGNYYTNTTFTGSPMTRTDPKVDFQWPDSPIAGVSSNNFSVAWTGQIEPQFSELYTFFVTANDSARLWVDDQMLAARLFPQASGEIRGQMRLKAGQRANLRLEFIEHSGDASVRLEWSSPSQSREIIPAARFYPARVDRSGGSIMEEHWSAVGGAAISDLTSSTNFAGPPSGRELLTSFECLATNWEDSYGTRVSGFIVPPASANYTFAVSGDDAVQLFLSTNADPANRTLIASVTSATAFRQWTNQANQQSTPRALVQGEFYYVELLHKEDSGADHWSVGWMKPGDTNFTLVPGSALVQPGIGVTQPATANLFDTLAVEHPRILATRERFAWLRQRSTNAASSTPKSWAQSTINAANTDLTDPVAAFTNFDARTEEHLLYELALAWNLTGDARYADRAWVEVSNYCTFPDWRPSSALDHSMLTHTVGIAYDWMYSYWSPAQRDTILTNLIAKGLVPTEPTYSQNIGIVQSSCRIVAALAAGKEAESTAEGLINSLIGRLRTMLPYFSTDNGSWLEGTGYGIFAKRELGRGLGSLEWALGSDFGLSTNRNLWMAGVEPYYIADNSRNYYTFADVGTVSEAGDGWLNWWARRYNLPLAFWWSKGNNASPLSALWFTSNPTNTPASDGIPPDMAYHGEAGTPFQFNEIVTLRTGWTNSRGTFIGCKGGGFNGSSHSMLDPGTFTLSALGKRWFYDLSSDDYALSGYFTTTSSSGSDRWDYYRTRGEGHNTMILNPGAGPDIDLKGFAPLMLFQSEPASSNSVAVFDRTSLFPNTAWVWRGFELFGARDQVLVQDEVTATTAASLWWFAHYQKSSTAVVVAPDGLSAMLTQTTNRLWCKIVSGGGTFQVMDAVPLPSSPNPAGQNGNTNYGKVAIHLTGVTNTTLAVWFVPLVTGQNPPTELPLVIPLTNWAANIAPNAPAAPSNLNATASGPCSVNLNWSDNATNELGFILERSLTSNSNFSQLALLPADATNFNDRTVSPATAYYYRLRSYSGLVTCSAYTPEVSVTTPMPQPEQMTLGFLNYDRTEALTNFPALVVFGTNLSGFDYDTFATPDAADLRFKTADGMTDLNYDIEDWNSGGKSHVWVQVPLLTNGASIIARWGDPNATNAIVGNGATWSNAFLGVWHLNETSGPHFDASPLTATSRVVAVTQQGIAAGAVGSCDNFDGVSNYVSLPDMGSHSQVTVECWVNLNGTPGGGDIGLVSSDPWTTGICHFKTTSAFQIKAQENGGSTILTPTNTVSVGSWFYAAYSIASNGVADLKVYTNGVFAGAATGSTNNNLSDLNIAREYNGRYLNARVDEVRISSVVRSPNWLWATYQNIASNQTFVSYGNVDIVPTNPLPMVDFTGNPIWGVAPLTVSFTNRSSGATSFNWLFGDGNTSANIDPVNVYTNPGIYTVSLTAIGAGGTNTLTRTGYVTVMVPGLRISGVNRSGTRLTITGTGGTGSWTYYVLSSTNVALSLNLWERVATNQFDAAGSFLFNITPDVIAPRSWKFIAVQSGDR